MRRPVAVLFILIAIGSCPGAEPFHIYQPVTPPRPVQVMVHRGLASLAPENTLPAIAAAASDYIEWAEVDVRLTRDGHHVLLHDATLDRTTTGKGNVVDAPLTEIKKLDAGAWFAPRFAGTPVPTLTEVLTAARGKINLYLDCKQIDPPKLVTEILAAGMERQVVVYGEPSLLEAVRTASGGKIAGMTKYRAAIDLPRFLKETQPAAVEIDAEDVTAELCQKFRAAGIIVQAKVLGSKWDNPATWERVVTAGANWVQTDDAVGFRAWELRKRLPRWPVRIAFHRGANRYAPENTLPAIQEAVRLGADYVEIDVRPTKDKRYVLLHDRTVNRTTSGIGPISEIAFDDVRKFSAGAWFARHHAERRIPTLDEGLTALGGKAHVYLDAKDIPPEQLLAAIKKHGLMERHAVYQSMEYAARLKALDSNVRLLPPLGKLADLPAVAEIKPYGVDAKWNLLSKEMIADCHRRGIIVFSDALGFNESVEQYRKVIRWGIDVIQTDYPARVYRAIELESGRSGP